MADLRISEVFSLINQEINSHETLSALLSKAEALAHVGLSDCFLGNPKPIIHDYLWALSDVIEKARELNELSLTILLHQNTLNKLKQGEKTGKLTS